MVEKIAKSISYEFHGVLFMLATQSQRMRQKVRRHMEYTNADRYIDDTSGAQLMLSDILQTFLLHSSRQRCCCSKATDLSASLVDRAIAAQRLTSIMLNVNRMQP